MICFCFIIWLWIFCLEGVGGYFLKHVISSGFDPHDEEGISTHSCLDMVVYIML